MTEYNSKLKRQVLLLVIFAHERSIIDLEVIQKSVSMNIRTLQRDINELSEAGFLKASYDRTGKRYRGEVYFPDSLDHIPAEKRKYYQNMIRFMEIIFHMDCLTYRDIEYSLDILHMNIDQHFVWIEDGKYGPEPKYEDIRLDKELSADKVYHELFPGAGKKEFERDLRFLREIGYPIEYDEELGIYYKDFPEELPA